MNSPLIKVKEEDKIEIQKVFQKLQHYSFDFSACTIDISLIRIFFHEISQTRFHLNFLLQANKFLHETAEGYLIIDFGENYKFENNLKSILIITLMGILQPFGIFNRFG